MKFLTRLVQLALAIVAAFTLSAPLVSAGEIACPVGQSVSEQDIPQQARETLALITSGGPFSGNRDGVSFGNREHILPKAPRGYYREYTVRTPGVKSRGARRIVCGGNQRSANACYYSDDHYQTFKCIQH